MEEASVPIGDVVFDPTFVVCLHKSMGVPFNDRDPEYDEWLNLDYHDFVQAGGSVGLGSTQRWPAPKIPPAPWDTRPVLVSSQWVQGNT